MSESGERLPRMPALDGLRGLALAGVVAFHADGALVGGYLGVDLFFVLSGFLITSLLVAEHRASNRIDLRAFWARRARRLLPALFVLVPAIVVYANLLARPADVRGIRDDTLATLFYFANWRAVWSDKSYWDLFTAPSPLQHTWSLAIEEQFYLLWPLVAAIALRKGRRSFAVVSALLLAGAIAVATWTFRADDVSRVYYGTDTRASAILIGALFALAFPPGTTFSRSATRTLDALGIVALVVTAWAWVRLDGNATLLYRGGFWVTEILGAVLVVCAVAGNDSWIARALAFTPLRLLGTVSYGAYLWHWPIDVVVTSARVHLTGAPLQLLRVALTILVSVASYLLVERPIRRGAWPRRRPLAVALAASVAVTVLAVVGMQPRATEAALRRWPPPPPTNLRLHVTMVGDSTAGSLGWALRGVRDTGVVVALEGHDGFNLIGHRLPDWPDVPTHTTMVELGGAFLYGVHVDGQYVRACHPVWDARFAENLSTWLAARKPVNGRVRVATIPYPFGPYDDQEHRDQVDCINREIRAVVARTEGVEVFPLAELLCPGGACTRSSPAGDLRPDGVHYDLEAARDFARQVIAALEK